MSCCMMMFVVGLTGIKLMSGVMVASMAAVAAGMNLKLEEDAETAVKTLETVDICVDNMHEITGDPQFRESRTFAGNGVRLTFFVDGRGETGVRVSGTGSREELERLGHEAATRLVQQYAYNRVVEEMEGSNMTLAEQEVLEDGTIQLRVRVFDA